MADQLTPQASAFFNSMNAPVEGGLPGAIPPLPSSGPAYASVDNHAYDSIGDKALDFVRFGAPAAAVGAVDSLLSSVGLVDDDRIGNYLTSTYSKFGDYYQNNKETAQGIGGAVGMLIPGMAATKVVSGSGMVARGVAAAFGEESTVGSYLAKLFTSGKSYDELLAGTRARSMAIASQGVTDFTSDARLTSMRSLVGMAGPATDADEVANLTALGVANRGSLSPLTTLAIDRLKDAVAFDVGAYAAYNKNEMLYPSDQSYADLFAMNMGIATAFVAPEMVYLNRAITRAVADAAPIANRARNPVERELSNIIYRDGSRDLGITQTAQVVQDLDQLQNTTQVSQLYKTEINKQQLSLKAEISDQLDKFGNETTAWGIKDLTDKAVFDQGHKGTIFAALDDNPVQLLGAKAISNVPTDMIQHLDAVVTKPNDLKFTLQGSIDASAAKIEQVEARRADLKNPEGPGGQKMLGQINALKDDAEETKQSLDALNKSEWFVLDPNQGVLLADRAKTKYNYDGSNKVLKTARSENEPSIFYTPDGRNAVTGDRMFKQGFNELGFFNSEKLNTKFSDLGFYERSAAFNSVNRAVKEFNPNNALDFNFGKSDGWLRFDYALKLEEKNPGFLQKATFPQEWQGNDRVSQLQWASLNDKFQDWNKLQDVYESQLTSNMKIKPHQLLTPEDIRYQLNLPNQQLGQVGPIEEVFHSLRAEGQEKLSDAFKSLDDFKQAMQTTQDTKYGTPMPYTKVNPELKGNSFDIATTKLPGGASEITNKPVLLVKQPMTITDEGKNSIENSLALVKSQTMADLSLATKQGSQLVGPLVDFFNGSSASGVMRDLDQLANGTTGSASATTQMFNARTNPVLEGALVVSQNSDQIGGTIKQKFFSPYRDQLTALLDANNVGDKLEWNMATQARQFRWDLKEDGTHIQTIPSGTDAKGNPINRYGYVLADTPGNRAKLNQYFPGTPFSEDMLMPSMLPGETYKPLTIGQAAHDGMLAISGIGSSILDETNILKRVLGKSETRKIPLWTVPPDLTQPGNTIGYILRGEGNLKTTLSGQTPAELAEKVTKEFAAMSPEERAQSRFVNQKDVAANADLHDQVFGNLLDFSDPIAQTGRATGSIGLRTLDSTDNLLKNSINALDDQLDRVISRTRITYFESEINRVRQMADASANAKKAGNPTIYQQYINAVEGRSDYSARTPVGQIYSKIEGQYDDTMNALYSRYQSEFATPRSNDPEVKANIAKYAKISEQLGDFNPWQNVQDFLGSTYKASAPPTMREHMGFLSRFTSTAVLRFLEVGQTLNDTFSLAATLPSVLSAVRKLPTEDLATWSKRVGAYATPISDDVAIPSAGKILASTLHDRLNNPEFQAAMVRAKDKGYFTERANDALDVFAVKGDDFIPNILSKGMAAANYLTDKSFETSRAIAFGAGYKLGKDGFGLTNEADLFTFAKKIADDTIGNYTSRNKPQIFQGAVGMPLGLFQTFTVNYFQRMLGYVENKQYKQLAIQMGLQAAVFGGRTLPGMDQFTNYWASSHDGINNPVDYMNAHFGPQLTDLLMYGTVSNIPKIWESDGVAFYQRGDANVRVPGSILDYQRSAPYQLGKQVFGGISAAADMLRQGGQFSGQQVAEIISRSSVNRPIRHLAELAAGSVTDSRGAVVTNDVWSGMSVASRILGYKPLVEAKEAEMMGRLQVTQQSQQAKMARLEGTFRSAFRSGGVNGDAMAQGLRDYVEAGGNPKSIGAFIKNQYIIATLPRAQRALMDDMGNPTKMADTLRMINAVTPGN